MHPTACPTVGDKPGPLSFLKRCLANDRLLGESLSFYRLRYSFYVTSWLIT